MNFFAQIALKFLPAWATTAWPYVAFYLANRQLFKKWIDLSKEIIEKFKREHPDAARVPTETEVVEALQKSSSGKTTFTPKKVREWTPAEWKNYWDRASGTGQF